MKIKHIIRVFLSLTFVVCQKYGGGPNAFYQLQTSAREVALGYTGIASSKGPFSIYWNPARILSEDKKNHVIYSINLPWNKDPFSQSNDSELGISKGNFSMISAGMIKQIEDWSYGLNILYRGFNNITGTHLNVNNEIQENGTFDYSNGLVVFSIANRIKAISTGLSLKYAPNYSPQTNNTPGYGVDFGLSLNITSKIKYGFVIKLDQHHHKRQIRTGTGVQIGNLEMDINGGDNMPIEFGSGYELPIGNIISLRIGINHSINENFKIQPRFIGFGFGFENNFGKADGKQGKKLLFDFSYSYYISDNEQAEYLGLVDYPLKINISYAL